MVEQEVILGTQEEPQPEMSIKTRHQHHPHIFGNASNQWVAVHAKHLPVRTVSRLDVAGTRFSSLKRVHRHETTHIHTNN